MGLGGHMMWTAVARELRERYKDEHGDFKILPLEGGGICNSDIFKNNPNFIFDVNEKHYKMNLSNPDTNYCIKEENGRAYHRYDKHIIEQTCEYFGIDNPKLKCELYLTDDENKKVDYLIKDLPKKYVTVEPHAKNGYTINKEYSFDKWQNVIDYFKDEIDFVQIGIGGKKVLNGVIDFTGKTTYRETNRILQNCMFHIGTEGGLIHNANACNKKAVCVVPGFMSPTITAYPENKTIQICSKCKQDGPCGLLTQECKDGKKYIKQHNEKEIIEAIKQLMKEL
tara:strand:+ start:474 stop:1319 length:846 start_codon:yes stop_codon:yes gene_type:complete